MGARGGGDLHEAVQEVALALVAALLVLGLLPAGVVPAAGELPLDGELGSLLALLLAEAGGAGGAGAGAGGGAAARAPLPRLLGRRLAPRRAQHELLLWHGGGLVGGLGEALDPQLLGRGEEHLQVLLVHVDLAVVHEVEDGHHVGEANPGVKDQTRERRRRGGGGERKE